MKENVAYWLRWVAVLPSPLLAGLLALFPLHWIVYHSLRNQTIFVDPYPELPERLLTPFVACAVFVWAGSRIAPERKVLTSVVLLGLLLLLQGGFVFLAVSGTNVMGAQFYLQGRGIAPIMALAGALVGLYIVRRKNAGDSL